MIKDNSVCSGIISSAKRVFFDFSGHPMRGDRTDNVRGIIERLLYKGSNVPFSASLKKVSSAKKVEDIYLF